MAKNAVGLQADFAILVFVYDLLFSLLLEKHKITAPLYCC